LTPRLEVISDLVGAEQSVLIVGEAPTALSTDLEQRGCKVRVVALAAQAALDAEPIGPDRASPPGSLSPEVAWDSFSVVVVFGLEGYADPGALLGELSAAAGSGCRLVATFKNATFAGIRLAQLAGAPSSFLGPPGLTRSAAEDLFTFGGWDVLHAEAMAASPSPDAEMAVPAAVADWVAATPEAGVAEYAVLCHAHRHAVDGMAGLVRRLSADRASLGAEAVSMAAALAESDGLIATLTTVEADLRRQLDQVAETATEADLEVLELEDKLYQRNHALAEAQAQMANQSDNARRHEEHALQLRAELERREQAFNQLRQMQAELREHIANQDDGRRRLEDHAGDLRARLQEYVGEVERREQALIQLHRVQADLEHQLARAEPLAARAEASEAQLAEVLASRSWRWARLAAAVVARLRGR
jgi:hypothetical protein